MEKHVKGKGVPCLTVRETEHEEVIKFEDFLMNGACQYTE
jgi:hypothetical protein